MELIENLDTIVGFLLLIGGILVSMWRISNKLNLTLNNLNNTTAQLSEHLKETKSDVEDLKEGYYNHETRISILERNKNV